MRVGVKATVLGSRPTGPGVYTLPVVEELDALPQHPVVYTSAPLALAAGRHRVRRAPRWARPERHMMGHAVRMLWLQTMLRAHLRRDQIDVLLNTLPEGLSAPKVPQVTVVHDLLPLRYPEEYPRQQYYFRFLVPRVLASSQ